MLFNDQYKIYVQIFLQVEIEKTQNTIEINYKYLVSYNLLASKDACCVYNLKDFEHESYAGFQCRARSGGAERQTSLKLQPMRWRLGGRLEERKTETGKSRGRQSWDCHSGIPPSFARTVSIQTWLAWYEGINKRFSNSIFNHKIWRMWLYEGSTIHQTRWLFWEKKKSNKNDQSFNWIELTEFEHPPIGNPSKP